MFYLYNYKRLQHAIIISIKSVHFLISLFTKTSSKRETSQTKLRVKVLCLVTCTLRWLYLSLYMYWLLPIAPRLPPLLKKQSDETYCNRWWNCGNYPVWSTLRGSSKTETTSSFFVRHRHYVTIEMDEDVEIEKYFPVQTLF